MRELILNHLKEAGEPLPANKILKGVLQIHSPSEPAANRVLKGILGDDNRFVFTEYGWYIRETGTPYIWDGECVPICFERSRDQRWIRGAILFPSEAWRIDSSRISAEQCAGLVTELQPRLAGSVLAGWSDRDLRLMNFLFRKSGIQGWAGDYLALQPLAGRLLSKHPGSIKLPSLAKELRLAVPDEHQPEPVARFLSSCLPLLLDRVRAEYRVNAARLVKWVSDGKEPVDFSRFNFGPAFPAQAPESPGVYIMRDREGTAIYVGKSRNLRSRLHTYFTPGGMQSAKTARIHDLLYSLEWQQTANEVEALLMELRLIRKLKPSINLQTEVHANRKSRQELNLLMIAAADSSPTVTIYFLRRGSFAGKQSTAMHRPPGPRLRSKIKSVYFSKFAAIRRRDYRQEAIVSRWIAQNRNRLNWIDVDEAGSYQQVLDRLHDYLNDPEDLRKKVYYR